MRYPPSSLQSVRARRHGSRCQSRHIGGIRAGASGELEDEQAADVAWPENMDNDLSCCLPPRSDLISARPAAMPCAPPKGVIGHNACSAKPSFVIGKFPDREAERLGCGPLRLECACRPKYEQTTKEKKTCNDHVHGIARTWQPVP